MTYGGDPVTHLRLGHGLRYQGSDLVKVGIQLEPHLTKPAVARRYSISGSTVWRMINAGLTTVNFGRAVRIPESDLATFLTAKGH